MKLATPDTWPDLRFIFRPLPWTWHLLPRFYADDPHPAGHWDFQWLFLTVEWWAEDKPRWWFFEDAERIAHHQAVERSWGWHETADADGGAA